MEAALRRVVALFTRPRRKQNASSSNCSKQCTVVEGPVSSKDVRCSCSLAFESTTATATRATGTSNGDHRRYVLGTTISTYKPYSKVARYVLRVGVVVVATQRLGRDDDDAESSRRRRRPRRRWSLGRRKCRPLRDIFASYTRRNHNRIDTSAPSCSLYKP